MFMLEAGKSYILDAIGTEDANRLGKTIKLKKRIKVGFEV